MARKLKSDRILFIATLLFDLLTAEEEESERRKRHLRFDIAMLAQRLLAATRCIAGMGAFEDLPLGYFGANTGAAATLVAAAEAEATGAHFVRLQCYEGLDAAQALPEADARHLGLELTTLMAIAGVGIFVFVAYLMLILVP